MTVFYKDDATELRSGDCLDPVAGLASLADRSVDIFITDPPYSEHVHRNHWVGQSFPRGRAGKIESFSRAKELGFAALDSSVRIAAAAEMARLVRRWVLVFSDLESAHLWRSDLESVGLEWVRTGIWHKLDSAPQFTGDRPAGSCEAITICHPPGRKRWNGGGHHAFWEHAVVINVRGSHRVHTAEKPLALMRELVRLFSDPGETIVDPFAGFCTTLRAAKDLDRRSLGWELQEKYLEPSVRRLGQAVLWKTPKQGTLVGNTEVGK
jgi:site-specific DNA-methyltransferase (adenine-specific)